jgi:Glycosyl transferase family 2
MSNVQGESDVQISVCVPTYRRHRPPNLTTLGRQLPAALQGLSGELVVVLNGISARRAGVPPGAETVTFEENHGVPIAWNAAARAAAGDVLVFCNDDVELGPGSLRMLADSLESRPDAGVVGPVGSLWDFDAAEHLEYLSGLPPAEPGAARECDVVSGFLFATPKRVWSDVGGFDESYSPCGFEEVDYCAAVRHQLNLSCLAVHGVDYRHVFGISSRRHWRRISWSGGRESIGSITARNRAHFKTKWAARAQSRSAVRRSS